MLRLIKSMKRIERIPFSRMYVCAPDRETSP